MTLAEMVASKEYSIGLFDGDGFIFGCCNIVDPFAVEEEEEVPPEEEEEEEVPPEEEEVIPEEEEVPPEEEEVIPEEQVEEVVPQERGRGGSSSDSDSDSDSDSSSDDGQKAARLGARGRYND